MKINKIDHICVAVKNLEDARRRWEPFLGKSKPDMEYVDEREKIKVARYVFQGVGFELMESISPEGEVARFIEKRGEGIMLISFHVDDTRQSVRELQTMGYPLIPDNTGEVLRPFGDCEFAFIHPRKLNGVLTEVIDYKWD